jgi:hypothetical protein
MSSGSGRRRVGDGLCSGGKLHHTTEGLRAARDEIRRRADDLFETRDKRQAQIDQ